MLAKRVIACLDVRDGRVVKGVNFAELRDAGSPVELAGRYCDEGVDELVMLDVSATLEERLATLSLVRDLARTIDVPLTVGGGVRDIDDIGRLLEAGADKVSVNSAALARPILLMEAAQRFGSQCVMLAVDVARAGSRTVAASHSGTRSRDVDAVVWARDGAALGAGEILLTSIAHDGSGRGFDCDMIERIAGEVDVPVIASGGASDADSFADAFAAGADATLGASCFHFGRLSIGEVKSACDARGFVVRK